MTKYGKFYKTTELLSVSLKSQKKKGKERVKGKGKEEKGEDGG